MNYILFALENGTFDLKSMIGMTDKNTTILGRQSPHAYTPTAPENAPAVLTFSNVTVSKRGSNKKKLLKNVTGTITGGMWAIMGKLLNCFAKSSGTIDSITSI